MLGCPRLREVACSRTAEGWLTTGPTTGVDLGSAEVREVLNHMLVFGVRHLYEVETKWTFNARQGARGEADGSWAFTEGHNRGRCYAPYIRA